MSVISAIFGLVIAFLRPFNYAVCRVGTDESLFGFVAMGELNAAEVEHAIAEILVASFLLPDDLKQA